MPRKPPRPAAAFISDDELVTLAQRYRREALAALVSISRDENAPAAARAAAASKLLDPSDGTPAQAPRQIAVTDLAAMDDDLRLQLLSALIDHYRPNGFEALVQEKLKATIDEALAYQAAQVAALPVPVPASEPSPEAISEAPGPEAAPEAGGK